MTGDLGLFADFEEVFSEVDTRLLLATVVLVLVLLGAIYRAPLIAIIPIVVVGLGYQVATRSSTSTPTRAITSTRTRRAS